MDMRSYLCIASAAAICGCSTTPKSVIPDGRNRVEINSRAAIEQYVAQLAIERTSVDSRTVAERQLATLRNDVDKIKLEIAALQSSGTLLRKGHPVANNRNPKARNTARPSATASAARNSVSIPRRHAAARASADAWTFQPADPLPNGGAR